ncbi:hypothetical protein COCNU_01G009780 [Cocos nucifera]|uniref:Uncharacterized protein n=1 Tax=Cocos nucifera TaxID=13894 RepID=A0A8K0HV33_COCNU|nr:hypothetical protein COCNU_01G009780 [Cocos nucifera]
MSFLAGRLAATEGAYFLQESKHAVGRLAQKHAPPTPSSSSAAAAAPKNEEAADILPEILRHSIPLKGAAVEADPSLSTASKWLLKHSSSRSPSAASPDSLNPLRAYVSLPQATFGPKRWQLPNEHPKFSASTANELRHDRYPPMDSEKLKAVVAGYSQIGKAFAVATMMVFGGATVVFLLTAHKLQLHSTDDIRTKGRDLIQPGADIMREQMVPLRNWAENMSRKWHIEDGKAKEKSLITAISKTLGGRTSD